MRVAMAMVLLVVGAGCGGSPATECQFNSDCPAGRYCEDGRCTADCADDSDCVADLGAGAVCDSFGMCIAPPDGGPPGFPDAYVPPLVDSGPPPEGDAGADAGSDAPVPDESCTPSVPGATAEDEDADGSVDEGCEWFFGTPHAVLDLQPSAGGAAMVHLSRDGLRAYVLGNEAGPAGEATSTRRLFVATRTSREARFSAPVAVAMEGAPVPMGAGTMSDDELTLYFDDDDASPRTRLYRSARASTADAFGAPVELTALNLAGVRTYTPAISRDGLELFFSREPTGARELWVSQRTSTTAEFGAPTRLSVPLDLIENPRPDLDGLGLFFIRFSGAEWRVYYARRTAVGATTYEGPVELASLTGAGYGTPYFVSQWTREIWVNSTRPWATGGFSVFRAEICRDGACRDRRIDCATGTRSPDGQHCYFLSGDPATMPDAHLRCAAAGAHLPTIHSEAERDLIYSFRRSSSDAVWLGGYDGEGPGGGLGLPAVPECVRPSFSAPLPCRYRWTTDEPWFYAPWGSGLGTHDPNDPANEDCTVLWTPTFDRPGDLADINCGAVEDVVCESEQWPTW